MFLGVDYYKCKRGDERFSIVFPPISMLFFSKCMIKDQKQNLYFKILCYHAFTLLCIDVLSCFNEF
jgi:hypothetical protein